MGCFAFVFIGMFSGWIAEQLILDGNLTLFQNLILGVIGSMVGGFIFEIFGEDPPGGFIGQVITSVFGAIAFLFLVSLIF